MSDKRNEHMDSKIKTQKVVDAVYDRSKRGMHEWEYTGYGTRRQSYKTTVGGEIFCIAKVILEISYRKKVWLSVELIASDTKDALLEWSAYLSENGTELALEVANDPLSIRIFNLFNFVKKTIDEKEKRIREQELRELQKSLDHKRKRLDSFLDNLDN